MKMPDLEEKTIWNCIKCYPKLCSCEEQGRRCGSVGVEEQYCEITDRSIKSKTKQHKIPGF